MFVYKLVGFGSGFRYNSVKTVQDSLQDLITNLTSTGLMITRLKKLRGSVFASKVSQPLAWTEKFSNLQSLIIERNNTQIKNHYGLLGSLYPFIIAHSGPKERNNCWFSFSLKILLVNVSKLQIVGDLFTFAKEILSRKLYFYAVL